MNGNDITTELLKASLLASKDQQRAALKILRGEKPVTGPFYLTGTQAARLLGISRTTFRRWGRAAGLAKVEVLPNCFRYRRGDVETMAIAGGDAQ